MGRELEILLKHRKKILLLKIQIVVYVIPARNSVPTLRAEYANGREVHVNAKGFTLERAEREVHSLQTRSGEPIVKFVAHPTASCRSLQGQWSSLK
uniref:Uncharacterized protein n=1 Tax=Panagrolaimus davidi TaxID=227884 RepID=A0A914QVW2_9BILA